MSISKNVIPVLISTPQATGFNRYTDGNDYVVVDANGITFTGDRTSGDNVIANVTVPTGLTLGMFLVGTGIPAGTYVTAIGATSVTMSANASANSSATVTVQSEILRYPSADVVERVASPGAPVAEVLRVQDVYFNTANNTLYSFNIVQQPNLIQEPFAIQTVAYLSDPTATATEIANGLASAVNALYAGGKVKCTAVAVPGSNKITITGTTGYPLFVLNAFVNTVGVTSFTGTTTSGSATVTTSVTTGLFVGMVVTGVGIPAATTISSISAGVSVTLSANATASGVASLTASSVTTAGAAAVGTGAQVLATYPPSVPASQVFGFDYASVNNTVPSTSLNYRQGYISVKVQPSMSAVAADLATRSYVFIINNANSSNATACLNNILAV